MLDTLQLYGDSLMTHGTLPRMGSVAAFVPVQDPWIGTVLMVCLLILLLALAGESRGLAGKLLSLVAPAGSRAAQEVATAQVTASERWRTLFFMLIQAVALSVLHLSWVAQQHPWFCGTFLSRWDAVVTPVLLMVVEAVLCLGVLWVRRLLYLWVHATFFGHDARMRWRLAYRLTMGAEATFLLASVCLAGGSEIGPNGAFICAIVSALLAKMGLLWCAWHVFFVKKRAVLHFFAYLCSAELIPLAILWLLLGILTLLLTV